MSECPICSQTFPADKLELHASTCLEFDQQQLEAVIISGSLQDENDTVIHHEEEEKEQPEAEDEQKVSLDQVSEDWKEQPGAEDEQKVSLDQVSEDCFKLEEEKQADKNQDVIRVSLKAPVERLGDPAKAHHYLLCERQFNRLLVDGQGQRYRLCEVEVVINSALRKRYNDHKSILDSPVEYWTFHGTSDVAIDAILLEGFRTGATGWIWSSESANFAMGYSTLRGGGNRLLLCRVCPRPDHQAHMAADQSHVVQMVVNSVEQILPMYVLSFEKS